MMSYEEFKNKLQEQIVKYLEEGCTLKVNTVHKPNRDMEALAVIKPSNTTVGINLCFEDLYDEYFGGEAFDDVVQNAAEVVNREDVTNVICLENIFANVKQLVFPCLVNTDKNREYLETVPHREFLDLSIIYKKVVEGTEGVATLTNSMLENIGMTEEELYEAAIRNMVGLNGIFLGDVVLMLHGFLFNDDAEDGCIYLSREELVKLTLPENDCFSGSIPLYRVSNRYNVYGSSAFLVPELWKGVSDFLNESVYIWPNSVHELLFMKESTCEDTSHLIDMIHEANYSLVAPEDFLSNNLYFYNKDTGEISIVA